METTVVGAGLELADSEFRGAGVIITDSGNQPQIFDDERRWDREQSIESTDPDYDFGDT